MLELELAGEHLWCGTTLEEVIYQLKETNPRSNTIINANMMRTNMMIRVRQQIGNWDPGPPTIGMLDLSDVHFCASSEQRRIVFGGRSRIIDLIVVYAKKRAMCKYNSRLFWFCWVGTLSLVCGFPVLTYDDDYNSAEDDYDVIFDQRQNGTENVRLSVDGIMIAVPAPPSQSDISTLASSALLDILSSQVGSLDSDSSEEEPSKSTTTSTTTTTTTTTPAPTFQDQLVPVNLLGQSLSFLFNKGAEIPIKIGSHFKPVKGGQPSLFLLKKEAVEDESNAENDSTEDTESQPEPPKKSSKHKRR